MIRKDKVLLVEDNEYKKEDAIRILTKYGLTDIVHFNNFFQVYKLICNKHIIEYDLLILDLCFFPNMPIIGDVDNMPTTESGAKVLYHLLKNGYEIPVIVFSSEKDYMDPLNKFMFPKFLEYAKQFDNSPLFVRDNEIYRAYHEEIEENKELLSKLTFIIGHAHNEIELKSILNKFLSTQD